MSGYAVYEEHVSGNCRVDSSETKPTDEEIQQLLSGVTGGCGQLNMLNGSRRGGPGPALISLTTDTRYSLDRPGEINYKPFNQISVKKVFCLNLYLYVVHVKNV